MEIKKVFVAGAGLMGSGISQVCASAGLKVIICDVVSEALEKALKNIAWSVGKFIEEFLELPGRRQSMAENS